MKEVASSAASFAKKVSKISRTCQTMFSSTFSSPKAGLERRKGCNPPRGLRSNLKISLIQVPKSYLFSLSSLPKRAHFCKTPAMDRSPQWHPPPLKDCQCTCLEARWKRSQGLLRLYLQKRARIRESLWKPTRVKTGKAPMTKTKTMTRSQR